MGEIAEMMLDGTLDCETGELIDGKSPGYPRTVDGAEWDDDFIPSLGKGLKAKACKPTAQMRSIIYKTPCPVCAKGCKGNGGVKDHMRDAHPEEAGSVADRERLNAAASVLLSALVNILPMAKGFNAAYPGRNNAQFILDAEAAIAKAIGENQS